MRRLAILFLLLVASAVAAAQGYVSGTVRDSATGEPLPFVRVGIDGRLNGTMTDDSGRYHIEAPAGELFVLRFTHTGYRSREARMRVDALQVRRLDVALLPQATTLDEVTISEERHRQSAFTPIGVDKLDEAVGPSGGVEGVLKTLPDVSSNNELSSQYSVRGGSFDENLVYINGVEVFRPMLVRSGQQEGMSIINPDLVDYILFSPGGFDASYGDKLSSALDITYARPQHFGARLSASLLGASASVRDRVGERWSYAVGLRQHSNRYVLGSLDTRGSYTTSYTDLQALVGFRPSERLNLGLLLIGTRNVYGLVPESRTTTFGGFMMPMAIDIYFDGQEEDRYLTLLGALTFDWVAVPDLWRVRGHLAAQRMSERECYDVQSQYFLYELGLGQQAGEVQRFDRGVGTFLEHARNRLSTTVYTADVRGTRAARLGQWELGLRGQLEHIDDHLREWRLVDSAGFALPAAPVAYGDSAAAPAVPLLQDVYRSAHEVGTWRVSGFAQRELNFETRRRSALKVVAGVRGQAYRNSASDRVRTLVSPRLSVSLNPNWERDLVFRLAAGVYQQPPFYREYRTAAGDLCADRGPQSSYQATATVDWNLRLWDKPFKLTADLYGKYITSLVPYTVEGVRVRYNPELDAVGYAVGLSLRLNGELVKGLESWASLSVMQTQEDIAGDGLGWLARPTDQRFSFKMFLQDNIPTLPWWRMSLSLIYGSRVPVTVPMLSRSEEAYRMPAYFRIDWGNTVALSQFEWVKHSRLMRHVDEVLLSLEVFNLFNFRNVASYIWVADYENHYLPVPNYLTARQLNLKITVSL